MEKSFDKDVRIMSISKIKEELQDSPYSCSDDSAEILADHILRGEDNITVRISGLIIRGQSLLEGYLISFLK